MSRGGSEERKWSALLQLRKYRAAWEVALSKAENDAARNALHELEPADEAETRTEILNATCGMLPKVLSLQSLL